jgi:hypothetical protein
MRYAVEHGVDLKQRQRRLSFGDLWECDLEGCPSPSQYAPGAVFLLITRPPSRWRQVRSVAGRQQVPEPFPSGFSSQRRAVRSQRSRAAACDFKCRRAKPWVFRVRARSDSIHRTVMSV